MAPTIFLSFLLLLQHAIANYVDLSLEEFVQGVEEGRFNVLADVRTGREYENGHIPQSTLLENLASLGNAAQVATPEDLAGCESCPIVLFDTNGVRSRVALDFLVDAGFSNLFLFEGGINAWKGQRLELETGTNSVTPSCTQDTGVSASCAGNDLPASNATLPPSPPTVGRINESRRVSADELARLKANGEIGVIMDIREGHISGATLVGPITFENIEEKLASFNACFRCSVVVYGESAARAIAVLRSYGFASHLYEGPSVQEWEDSGNSLVTDESISPLCLNDAAAQQACEQQYLSFQNMPIAVPTEPTLATPTGSPTMVITNTSNNADSPTAIDSDLSSGADRWSFLIVALLVPTYLIAFIY